MCGISKLLKQKHQAFLAKMPTEENVEEKHIARHVLSKKPTQTYLRGRFLFERKSSQHSGFDIHAVTLMSVCKYEKSKDTKYVFGVSSMFNVYCIGQGCDRAIVIPLFVFVFVTT